MLASFTLETFSGHVGGRFALTTAGGRTVELELTDARAIGTTVTDSTVRQPFSLMFHGPPATPLGQGTYAISEPSIGSFDLFIVALQPDAAGPRYEAIFS
jgi:hypothetical protein